MKGYTFYMDSLFSHVINNFLSYSNILIREGFKKKKVMEISKMHFKHHFFLLKKKKKLEKVWNGFHPPPLWKFPYFFFIF